MPSSAADRLELAERAAREAEAGRVDDARRLITQALALTEDRLADATTDLRVLFLAFQFHFRQGELDEAERLVRRRLALAEQVERAAGGEGAQTARALCNLGLVLHHRGLLDAAEPVLRRALEIDRSIANEEGTARDLGTLAMIFEARNDLDTAEGIYLEALAIAERIGSEPLAASKYANLGDIALARGERDRARVLWVRALEIYKRLGPAMWVKEVSGKLAALDQSDH